MPGYSNDSMSLLPTRYTCIIESNLPLSTINHLLETIVCDDESKRASAKAYGVFDLDGVVQRPWGYFVVFAW